MLMSRVPRYIRSALVLTLAAVMTFTVTLAQVNADVKLPSLFSHHMVLQREHANPVWGWADPGEQVAVVLGAQTKTTKADEAGAWRVTLDPMPVGGPHKIVVEGKNRIVIEDVLVGEVWVCSGQSNMQWIVRNTYSSDLTALTASMPALRMISVPREGKQTPRSDFEAEWKPSNAENVLDFSAVGFFFGRTLHRTLKVPIGLINNAWGGSACEAWIPRPLLEGDSQYKPLIDRWVEMESKMPEAKLQTNHRPGNLYNGMLHPILGYGIRGAIWYQGESNASRAYQYRNLFPLMINSWRDLWKQGDFSFYWVQLADYYEEQSLPSDSSWAELREAQTMALQLPNTGQAVIIDLGEGDDIHPRNKEDVGERLARLALAKDYGVDIVHRYPELKSMERDGQKLTITFDHADSGLQVYDSKTIEGFSIAGPDRKFQPAEARLVATDADGKKLKPQQINQVIVWSEAVSDPVAVRYGWADNPICNLKTWLGLPVAPFRSDDWPGTTVDNH